MANRNDKDTTGRTVAIVGGGALLLLLLLRGKGSGLGGDGHGSPTPTSEATAGAAVPPPCRVRIDGKGIQTDGVPTDLTTMTDRCRAAGSAEIRATGDAITGVIADVVQALQAAGIQVWAATDVWNAARTVPVQRPQ